VVPGGRATGRAGSRPVAALGDGEGRKLGVGRGRGGPVVAGLGPAAASGLGPLALTTSRLGPLTTSGVRPAAVSGLGPVTTLGDRADGSADSDDLGSEVADLAGAVVNSGGTAGDDVGLGRVDGRGRPPGRPRRVLGGSLSGGHGADSGRHSDSLGNDATRAVVDVGRARGDGLGCRLVDGRGSPLDRRARSRHAAARGR
jgi:hypothetical protein